MRTKEYCNILRELGWPRIYLVPTEQYDQIEQDDNYRYQSDRETVGISGDIYPVISIRTSLHGKARTSTIYHEIGHHLWPNKPHWWIECFGEKMAGGGGRGYYSVMYNHSPEELPSRADLLKLARRSSRRFNG